jgi:hypothetical protein
MSIQIHDIEEFATYEQAFDFIQDHIVVWIEESSDDVEEALLHMAVERAFQYVQAACEWADQNGQEATS